MCRNPGEAPGFRGTQFKNVMKKILIIAGIVLILLIGSSWWSQNLSETPDLISRDGLHWHPELEIYVKGERVEIPENIGVGIQYAGTPTYDSGMRMTAMHSHDDLPVIHLEFPGLVREEDLTFGNFFKIWGRDIDSFGS